VPTPISRAMITENANNKRFCMVISLNMVCLVFCAGTNIN